MNEICAICVFRFICSNEDKEKVEETGVCKDFWFDCFEVI